MAPINKPDFADECANQSATFGTSPHYVMAIAELFSGIDDSDDGAKKGPFRITQEAWDADRNRPDLESVLTSDDVRIWELQVQFATVVTYRAQEALRASLNRFPTADELYAKWPNTPPPAGKTLQSALDATAQFIEPALQKVLGPQITSNPTTHANSATPGSDTVGTLTHDEWQKYCDILGARESGNKYDVVNKLGYSGRWQFGSLALQDLGYVNAHVSNKGMASPAAWKGKDGINSREAWLGSKPVQDSAMREYSQRHYQSLLNAGAVKSTSSAPHVAGTLAAAHLMGVGNAIKLKNGVVTSDAFGTTSMSYYQLLSKAFGGNGVFQP